MRNNHRKIMSSHLKCLHEEVLVCIHNSSTDRNKNHISKNVITDLSCIHAVVLMSIRNSCLDRNTKQVLDCKHAFKLTQ